MEGGEVDFSLSHISTCTKVEINCTLNIQTAARKGGNYEYNQLFFSFNLRRTTDHSYRHYQRFHQNRNRSDHRKGKIKKQKPWPILSVLS